MGAAKVLEPQLANSLALLAVAAGSRLRRVHARLGVRETRSLQKHPGRPSSPILSVVLRGWEPVWEYTRVC